MQRGSGFSLENFLGFPNTSPVMSNYVKERVGTPQLDLIKETALIVLTLLFDIILWGTRTIRQSCLDDV